MEYILFKQNGEYLGIRGSIPKEEENLIAIEWYEEFVNIINPKLENGVVVSGEVIIEVPQSVSTMRFWLAVYEVLGITEQIVLENVDKIQDTSMKIKIQIMLNKAQEFDRNNQMLNYMANELGISQGQLDSLFVNASKIEL